MKQRAQIVDAVGVVGMLVGVEHAVEPIDLGIEELLAQIRRGVDQDAGHAAASPPPPSRRSTRSEVRRRRFFGFFGSQSPQPKAGRGTPPDEPQPRMVNFNVIASIGAAADFICADCMNSSAACGARHFAEQAKEIRGGLLGDFVERNAARFGQDLGGLDHIGRLVALAAIFARREIRRIGLDQDAVGRAAPRRWRAARRNS